MCGGDCHFDEYRDQPATDPPSPQAVFEFTYVVGCSHAESLWVVDDHVSHIDGERVEKWLVATTNPYPFRAGLPPQYRTWRILSPSDGDIFFRQDARQFIKDQRYRFILTEYTKRHPEHAPMMHRIEEWVGVINAEVANEKLVWSSKLDQLSFTIEADGRQHIVGVTDEVPRDGHGNTKPYRLYYKDAFIGRIHMNSYAGGAAGFILNPVEPDLQLAEEIPSSIAKKPS